MTVCYPSFNGAASRTNSAGIAVFSVVGFSVSAPGHAAAWASSPRRWPLEVVLTEGN